MSPAGYKVNGSKGRWFSAHEGTLGLGAAATTGDYIANHAASAASIIPHLVLTAERMLALGREFRIVAYGEFTGASGSDPTTQVITVAIKEITALTPDNAGFIA